MRTIKFRGWNKVKKEMITDQLVLAQLGNGDFVLAKVVLDRKSTADGCFDLVNQNGFELMQFTGLLDKNGTEIYEGDIVRAFGKNEKEFEVGIVKFQKGYFYATMHELPFLWQLHPLEVIGNIYENSELLLK